MTVTTRSQSPAGRGRWLVGAASLAAMAVLVAIYLGQGLPWNHAIAAGVIVVVPGVGLGWALWRCLVRRAGAASGGGLSVLAGHVLQAAVFSSAWTAAIALLSYPVDREAAIAFLHNGAPWQFVGGLVMYGAIAAGARASVIQARLRERELAAAGAELQALRARLDPHFLFNTLHSLTQLAREDPAATEQALERFGELMRYVLDAGRDHGRDVALEQELAFVHDYLALERLRLGERLQVVEDIDGDALELGVPPLLLQPLVENAVRHGLAPRRGGGTLHLGAHLAEDTLEIKVYDDGCGAAAEAWEGGEGMGLKAVRRQLRAAFGEASGFRIETRPGAGFTVRLTLPARLPAGAAA